MADRRAFSQGGGGEEEKGKREVGEELDALHVPSAGRGRCELPYDLNFSYVLTSSVVLYFFPLLSLWVLNLSLYFKITRRKSLKIRRSLSVNDNYLLPFRKSSSESESSPPNNNNNGNEAGTGDTPGGGGGGGRNCAAPNRDRGCCRPHVPGDVTRWPSPVCPRSSLEAVSGRYTTPPIRLSPPEPFLQAGVRVRCVFGDRDELGGGGRAAAELTPGEQLWPVRRELWGCGIRVRTSSECVGSSSRKQSEDLVKELLVRQDKKAARLLGLLVTAFTLCWLPHTVTAMLRASDPGSRWLSGGWLRDLTFWVLVTNSAINPFMYGLLNAEFRKILRDWFYFQQRPLHSYRLKHALLYWSLPGNADSDGANKDAATTAAGTAATAAVGVPVASHALFATPIEE